MFKKIHIILGCAVLLLATIVHADTVGPILPTSEGLYKQWTPYRQNLRYMAVDETVCNGLLDYNWTSVVGRRDSYGVSLNNIPNGSKITKIDIIPCASNNSSVGTTSVMNVFHRIGGVDSADAGSYNLTGVTPVTLATTTFNNLSVIKAPWTSVESGVVLSSGNRGVRLSRLATVVTYAPFNAPSNLNALSTSTSVVLTWKDNSDFENGFVVERKNVTTNSAFLSIATTTPNATFYFDSGLVASTTYTYRVRGVNMGGSSAYSNTATTTIVN